MPTRREWLIAGLGNPGERYKQSRHNTGFLVVEEIASTHSIALTKSKFNTRFGRGSIQGVAVILAEPMAYMNRSGPPLRALADYYRISGEGLLIVHDDIDLTFGRLKIKEKGGHGGHNGVRSLMDVFDGGDFTRLRIGIGRSADGLDVTDHVLHNFSPDEFKQLDQIIKRACEAVETILCQGIKAAMNRYNDRRSIIAG